MSSVTIQEARNRLDELIDQLQPGDEVVITRDAKPIARLTTPNDLSNKPRRLGTLKGTVLYVAPDFDAPVEELAR